MMMPGLALFYAGLVRSKNVLSILMQSFALTAVLGLVWLVCGHSLSFTGDRGFIGTLEKAFLRGVTAESVYGTQTIPEHLWFAYQMMFFLITPGLFIGAFGERMKFSAIMAFGILWSLLVYVPVCYGVWHKMSSFGLTNVIDLAGGIVVHITAGVAALVACVMETRASTSPNTARAAITSERRMPVVSQFKKSVYRTLPLLSLGLVGFAQPVPSTGPIISLDFDADGVADIQYNLGADKTGDLPENWIVGYAIEPWGRTQFVRATGTRIPSVAATANRPSVPTRRAQSITHRSVAVHRSQPESPAKSSRPA